MNSSIIYARVKAPISWSTCESYVTMIDQPQTQPLIGLILIELKADNTFGSIGRLDEFVILFLALSSPHHPIYPLCAIWPKW